MSDPALERVEFYEHDLGEAELASVRQTLATLFLTLGPRVAEFERAFAGYLGAEHVVGVTSCSMALILSLHALGVAPGDEVITTPMTFAATSNAVLHLGATPVFVDVEPDTGLIDPAAVEAAIGPRTRAIVAVHLYGQMCDMRRLRAIADRHGLALIEDAAHAVEAERDGVRVTQLGDASTFSFYTTKNLTSGDGGAIAVHDAKLADRLKRLRNHGMSKDAAARHGGPYAHWDMVELGWKCPLTDIQAALLLPQIARIDEKHAARVELVARYRERLASVPGVELVPPVGKSGHHLFTVRVDAALRDHVLAELGNRQVGCAVNYRAIHTLAHYRERFGLVRDAFPHAASIGERTISLPLWPRLGARRVDLVVERLAAILAEAR